MPENSNPPVQCAAAVTFRAIRPSDADAVALLHALPGFRFGTLRLPHPSTERIRKWIETMPETHTELGAFECTALVGCGGLTRLSGRRAHTGMIGMGVHDEWTRRGIGTALLRELVTLAEDWHGLRRLELTVYADNTAAIALYRRFGFVLEGTHRRYARRAGHWVDACTMARLADASEDVPPTARTTTCPPA